MKLYFDTVNEACAFGLGYAMLPSAASSRRNLGAWFAGLTSRLVEDRTEEPIPTPLTLEGRSDPCARGDAKLT